MVFPDSALHHVPYVPLLAVLLSCMFATTVEAHPAVQEAQRAYERGAPGVALAALEGVESDPTFATDDLIQVHWYRGACLYALGRTAEGDAAFERLLELRPLYEPNRLLASPALRSAFMAKAEQFRRTRGILIGAPVLQGAMLVVPLWRHGERVHRVMAFVRATGDPTYYEFACSILGDKAAGVISDVELIRRTAKRDMLEVVLEARDAHGTPLARLGDGQHPLVISVGSEDRVKALEALLQDQQQDPAGTTPDDRTENQEGASPTPAHGSDLTDPQPIPQDRSTPVDTSAPGSSSSLMKVLARAALGGGVGLLLVCTVSVGLAAVMGLIGSLSYAGVWLHPRTPGARISPTFRTLLGGAVLGGTGSVALLVMAVLLAPPGMVGSAVGGVAMMR